MPCRCSSRASSSPAGPAPTIATWVRTPSACYTGCAMARRDPLGFARKVAVARPGLRQPAHRARRQPGAADRRRPCPASAGSRRRCARGTRAPRARRRPRWRRACRSGARRADGRAPRRRSPCSTATRAPASRSRPARRAGGSPPASAGCSCRSRGRVDEHRLAGDPERHRPLGERDGARQHVGHHVVVGDAMRTGARLDPAGVRAHDRRVVLRGDGGEVGIPAAPGVVDDVGARPGTRRRRPRRARCPR